MSEENNKDKAPKSLEDQITDAASAIIKQVKSGLEAEGVLPGKKEVEKAETPVEAKVHSPYDFLQSTRKSVDDLVNSKMFDEAFYKKYEGFQENEDNAKMKSYIWWKAFFGSALRPYEAKYHQVLKALSEGTDADGGYLVTPEFRNQVIQKLHHEGIMRPEVTVVPTSSDSVNFNTEDGRPKVSWGSENTTISTTTAGIAQTTISVHRMDALMYLSRELVADSNPSVIDWIMSEFATAVRMEEDAVLIGGSGSGRPKGLTQLTLTSNAAGAALTFEDLLDLEQILPIQYRARRARVAMYMSTRTLRDLRKLKDDQGMPIFLRSLDGQTPDTVLGYRVVQHDNFPEGEIYFGDLKEAYRLVDRQQMSVETTTQGAGAFEKHQLAIKVTERIGGDAVLTHALVKGTGYSA